MHFKVLMAPFRCKALCNYGLLAGIMHLKHADPGHAAWVVSQAVCVEKERKNRDSAPSGINLGGSPVPNPAAQKCVVICTYWQSQCHPSTTAPTCIAAHKHTALRLNHQLDGCLYNAGPRHCVSTSAIAAHKHTAWTVHQQLDGCLYNAGPGHCASTSAIAAHKHTAWIFH